jgi:predicted CoA-substrate-specific enzyme activase
MIYSAGIDIGSVNVKLSVIDENDKVVHFDSEKITTGPGAAVIVLIKRAEGLLDTSRITGIGISGTGKSIIPDDLGWTAYSSSLSVASGMLHLHPDARTIIQIGGQSSFVISLEDGLKKPWKVSSNPLCAAGTGRFMEQQAYRLGISISDFASLALQCRDNPPRIAARCSVFAKTDLIHLQQKGVATDSMLYALCESVTRMVASLNKGEFAEPVYFTGGVAANGAMVRALNEMLSSRNGHEVQVIVPEHYLFIEALGSALLSKGKNSCSLTVPDISSGKSYYHMPKLECVSSPQNGTDLIIKKHCEGHLGVDVGSTSTKAVILDDKGKVLAKHYLMTAGRPIDAVKEVFKNLLARGAGNIYISSVGVTGSGRYLIGSLIGADLIKNEITAQTRAAAEIDTDADIIEIGGQDSKLVIKRNGIVVDYQMNKACAAGTGSFIDELAEMLDISVKDGEFARLAFEAPYTIDLGTRCASFMAQSVATAQQEGLPLDVITASLSNSIAKNYLSKVVAGRRLGKKVILTGAVFYNQAVVSAFKQQLDDKELIVPEHKEISGAIGAALLAKENQEKRQSKFKGFREVIDSTYKLSTFTCKGCDNNCAITRMEVPGENPTFYGSRCDRYDSTLSGTRVKTAFDEREELLFREYRENAGTGPTVGIPRALLIYDYAPLLIGFLNALDVKVVLSSKTTKQIMEHSVELSYTDSCFPVKLLHGHAASLPDVDYMLFPCLIRLGKKDGEENQKYSCPLVQASPFIIRQVLGIGDRLLIPLLDFSQGFAAAIDSLADTAVKMGFSKSLGKKAALAGLKAQERFDNDKAALGKSLLKNLKDSGKLGVVLFARAYMFQDSGANLGIAEKLAQLGVVPIPLDFLPLNTVSPKQYSDRPYWLYESKFIAAADIAASNPGLFGLALTNFGCGPNSFILKEVEDIMGNKPLGQLEIDEHAAEAGIVTRLEAFVDTITGFAHSNRHIENTREYIYRGTSPLIQTEKTLLLPRMAPHADVLAAAMEAFGAHTIVLPEPDERNILYSNEVTSGTECLPFRVTLGDFIRFYRENGTGTKAFAGFMAGSYGPCRLGKYSVEQIRLLKIMGFDLPISTTVSNNAYRDLNLGSGFERLAWSGIVATDYLMKLVWRTRPYEKNKGAADQAFDKYLALVSDRIRKKEDIDEVLIQAANEFKDIIDPDRPRNPLIGINGEIFLRSNRFSNCNLEKVCEEAGLEVVVSPMGEWMKYTSYRNLEDALKDRKLKKIAVSSIKKYIQEHDENAVASHFKDILHEEEPSTSALLKLTSRYFSPKCGSEAVLSIGSGIDWMENPAFAGVISVMPHGCMPGGIVAAMAETFSARFQKPWISLTYDGFIETNNLSKINAFAEIIRYCNKPEL